jgi:hypothetical protein
MSAKYRLPMLQLLERNTLCRMARLEARSTNCGENDEVIMAARKKFEVVKLQGESRGEVVL